MVDHSVQDDLGDGPSHDPGTLLAYRDGSCQTAALAADVDIGVDIDIDVGLDVGVEVWVEVEVEVDIEDRRGYSLKELAEELPVLGSLRYFLKMEPIVDY